MAEGSKKVLVELQQELKELSEILVYQPESEE